MLPMCQASSLPWLISILAVALRLYEHYELGEVFGTFLSASSIVTTLVNTGSSLCKAAIGAERIRSSFHPRASLARNRLLLSHNRWVPRDPDLQVTWVGSGGTPSQDLPALQVASSLATTSISPPDTKDYVSLFWLGWKEGGDTWSWGPKKPQFSLWGSESPSS